MSIEMEFDGLDKIIDSLKELSSEAEMDVINTAILKEQSEIARNIIKSKLPKSKDVSKSGRKGSRTGKHYKDNVPISKVRKTKNGYLYMVVGIEKGDNSPYFYSKFLEWGTSKMKPRPIFAQTSETIQKNLDKKALKEYEKILKKKLEG
jgi:HK97 gp10 family phage protein